MSDFEKIKEAWKIAMPEILKHYRPYSRQSGCDVYFYPWRFTPIERNLWHCIRCYGIPFYPQVPVGKYFIDFGNPCIKVGLEADGKDWHSKDKDIKRDKELFKMGWTIYHIEGHETYRSIEEIDSEDEDGRPCVKRTNEMNSADGVVWAILQKYYNENAVLEYNELAERILNGHTLFTGGCHF